MLDAPDDQAMTVTEEVMEVHWNERIYELPCKVTFNVGRSPTVRISTSPVEFHLSEVTSAPQLEDSYTVKRKVCGQTIEVFPTEIPQEITDRLRVRWVFVPRQEPVRIDDAPALRCIRFAIANFGQFYVQNPAGAGMTRDRLELTGNGWSLKLEPMPNNLFGDVSAAESPLFKFTHTAFLTKEGGGDFTSGEAHEALDAIALFLSFCRGRWVAPALVNGLTGDGAVGMQEWGTRSVEPFTKCATWLDRMQAQEMSKAFGGYMLKVSDEEWQEAVRTAIYWYTRTNGAAPGVDGSIVLVQAALERFAWQMLVQNKHVLSGDGFVRLPAADSLRLLLDQSSIPLSIPTSLKALSSLAAERNWRDGPQAFVEVRNFIVHPPKKNKSTIDSLAIAEAWRIGQWYLELTLLRLFDFTGRYSNRISERQYYGHIENVPWI